MQSAYCVFGRLGQLARFTVCPTKALLLNNLHMQYKYRGRWCLGVTTLTNISDAPMWPDACYNPFPRVPSQLASAKLKRSPES